MPNRNMQAKMMKARSQAAAYAHDMADRQTFRDTTAIETVELDTIVAAFYARKAAELAARNEVIRNIRAGLGRHTVPGLKKSWRA